MAEIANPELVLLVRRLLSDQLRCETFSHLARRLTIILEQDDGTLLYRSSGTVSSDQIERVWRLREMAGRYDKKTVQGVRETIARLEGQSIEMQMITIRNEDVLGTLWVTQDCDLAGLILIVTSTPSS